jgi:hypothetical protein
MYFGAIFLVRLLGKTTERAIPVTGYDLGACVRARVRQPELYRANALGVPRRLSVTMSKLQIEKLSRACCW